MLRIRPNENLVADGLPAVPRSLAERSAPYMEFRTASFQDWNPVRPEMIILTRFADVPQLHRVKSPGAARTQLTSMESGSSEPNTGRIARISSS